MTGPTWVKSSTSGAQNCAEAAQLAPNAIGLRHSQDRVLMLVFTRAEWDAFTAGVKAGEFDHLGDGQ